MGGWCWPVRAAAVLAECLLFLTLAQAGGPARQPDCRMWLTSTGPELKD